jgi:hypothetical protein
MGYNILVDLREVRKMIRFVAGLVLVMGGAGGVEVGTSMLAPTLMALSGLALVSWSVYSKA